MTGAEAFRDAWLELAQPPTGLADIVKLLGGSRKVAGLLQVDQRTVQRYVNYAKNGKTKNNRRISAKERRFLRDLLQPEVTRRVVAEIRQRGLSDATFATGWLIVSPGPKAKRWHGTARPIGGAGILAEDLGEMCDAVLESDWVNAWSAFEYNLLIAYDVTQDGAHFDEVDLVHLEVGEKRGKRR